MRGAKRLWLKRGEGVQYHKARSKTYELWPRGNMAERGPRKSASLRTEGRCLLQTIQWLFYFAQLKIRDMTYYASNSYKPNVRRVPTLTSSVPDP
jgi:hypothetical protein